MKTLTLLLLLAGSDGGPQRYRPVFNGTTSMTLEDRHTKMVPVDDANDGGMITHSNHNYAWPEPTNLSLVARRDGGWWTVNCWPALGELQFRRRMVGIDSGVWVSEARCPAGGR